MPRSTKGTNCGQSTAWTSMFGSRFAMHRWYAPDAIVPVVPITPTRPLRVAATVRREAGSITPTTGTSYSSRALSKNTDAAVLHAITIILAPRATRSSAIAVEYRMISSRGLGPYGACAVSPTYMIDSVGAWSTIVRATVNPPTPESKTPMGLFFMSATLQVAIPGTPPAIRRNSDQTLRRGQLQANAPRRQ